MIYDNETKIKDLPESHFKLEIESLLKTAMMDFGVMLTQDVFSHTVNRLAYLIALKYKGFLLGEVKYVFEGMIEKVKSKLSVSTILQLFAVYYESKIEKQKQEYASIEIENINNANVWKKSPLGLAIIYKMNLYETGQLKMADWDSLKLKDIAEKLQSGELKCNYYPKQKVFKSHEP